MVCKIFNIWRISLPMSYADLSICEDMNKVCIYMYAYEIGEDPSVKCVEGHIMYILKIFAALFRLCIFCAADHSCLSYVSKTDSSNFYINAMLDTR